MTNEVELIARAQDGDNQALSELVEQHQQTIYNVALRMCGNADDAEETLQETFLNAIQALPRFEGRSKLSTWLYRIASNQCLMRRRRDAKAPMQFFIDEGDDPAESQPKYFVDWSYNPDDLVLDAELQEVMEAAIETLPPKLRLVFIWRELEGLSTAETAAVLEISESAVKVRLHRARLQLRERLSGYFAERVDVNAANGDGHA